MDPFERFIDARGYDEWAENRSWILGPAGNQIAEFVKTFKAFPPSQESMSVQVGSVAEMISQQALNR
jgi:arylsulfatase